NVELAVVEFAGSFNVRRIDDHRSLRLHYIDRIVDCLVGDIAVAKELGSRDTDSRSAQPPWVEKAGVIGDLGARRIRQRRSICSIRPSQNAEQDRGVAHRTRHRTGGILAVSNGNDPAPAQKSEAWLDADDTVGG